MSHGLIFSARLDPTQRSSGAHRIATFLRKNGLDVEVVDFAAHWELEELQEFIKKNIKSDTLFFAFSLFFGYWNDTLQQLVDWMKKDYPHIKRIVGGQEILHADVVKNIDIWVDSYGELAMLEIAKSLAGNTTQGIRFDLASFGTKKVIKALQSYPAYNLGDYSIIMEQRDFLSPFEWVTIEFSRGCKFACPFCNFPILGVKEDTSRTQESFELEMKYNYDNFGITNYYVADETFNDRVEKITKFADVVDKLDFKPFYSGFIRADLLPSNKEMVPELARMNFGGQYYGIETFNHKSGKVIGKGMDPDRLKACLVDTKNYMLKYASSYRGTISLIVGLPYDTEEDWNRNVNWLNTNWQSEALVVFPLDVQDLEATKVVDHTNVSKFSENLQKYGLRKMGFEKRERNFSFTTGASTDFWRRGNYANYYVMWEHDTMDVFTAYDIAEKMQDVSLYLKTDSWQLSNIDMIHNKKCMTENMDLPKIRSLVDERVVKTFLRNYINNKLNK